MNTVRGWMGREAADAVPSTEPTPVIHRVELRASANKPRRSLPTFRGLVGRPRAQSQGQAKLDRVRALIRDVFAPTQPVTDPKVFAGRVRLLRHLIEVIEHRMSHVVIFGERGIGKTSLLHILSGLAQESDYVVLRGTCGARSEFAPMFRQMLRGIPVRFHASVSPTASRTELGETLADLLPDGDYDARELGEVLAAVTSTRVLILLDEYDRIESEAFRQSIAELIKNLSDTAAQVHLVIAGVSSNLDELIGYIPSIRRNVIGVPVQRLQETEVRELLTIGEETSGLSFSEPIVALIAELGNGLPYLVRLIAYHSSMVAIDNGRFEIIATDVETALEQMIEETEARLPVLIAQRARSVNIERDVDAVRHLARIAATPNGWFTPSPDDSRQLGPLIEQLSSLNLIERRRVGESDHSFQFVDEGLPTFFWILSARSWLKQQREPKKPTLATAS